MTTPQISLLVSVLLLAAGTGALVARQHLQPPAAAELVSGTRLIPPRELAEFSLVSHRGQPFRREALNGQWTLMFFGFTHCPGICPATLATLVDVRKRLHRLEVGDQPRIVLVSVDPARDTPEQLAGYVAQFDPSLVGVTGPSATIDEFAASFGIAHRKIPTSGEDYMVDHSAVVWLLDPQARQAAVFSPPHGADRLATDYLRMLDRG